MLVDCTFMNHASIKIQKYRDSSIALHRQRTLTSLYEATKLKIHPNCPMATAKASAIIEYFASVLPIPPGPNNDAGFPGLAKVMLRPILRNMATF